MNSPDGIPLGRPNRPDEVAELVAFLASEWAYSTTGSEYVILGGNIPTSATIPHNLAKTHLRISPFNKSFNRMRVRDTGGWWRIVIDYGAKSANFCAGEGERGAIPTSASSTLFSLSTPPVHHNYSSTTRLTCLGVPFEEGVSFGQILQKARVENRPSPSARIWQALDHTPAESNASSRIPAAGRNSGARN